MEASVVGVTTNEPSTRNSNPARQVLSLNSEKLEFSLKFIVPNLTRVGLSIII